MRNRFNKQLTKEFNQAFEPNLDKDLLKEELNIQPKQTKCFSFKKKQFIALALTCVLLLVAVTSITTWAITKYQLFNDNSNPQTEEVDVIKMFQEKYPDKKITLVSKIESIQKIQVLIIHVSSLLDYSAEDILIVYCLEYPQLSFETLLYNLTVNGINFTDKISNDNDFDEYFVKYEKDYYIEFTLYLDEQKIFDFYTTI